MLLSSAIHAIYARGTLDGFRLWVPADSEKLQMKAWQMSENHCESEMLSPVEFGRFIHKTHSFLHPISLASWIPFSLVVVQHQQQVSREVNLNNLRFCMAASVLDGVLLFSLESGTIKMPLVNKDHSQIKQLF